MGLNHVVPIQARWPWQLGLPFYYSHLTGQGRTVLYPLFHSAPLSRFLPDRFTIFCNFNTFAATQLRVLFLSLFNFVLVLYVPSKCNSWFRRLFTRGTDPVVVQCCVPRSEPYGFRQKKMIV